MLTTQDAETDGNPTDTDTADFGGVFAIGSSAYGADGAAIYLYKIGDVIVGSTSATEPASATDASVAFSIAVDGDGKVTLTQYEEIDHAPPGETSGPYDDQHAVLNTGLVNLTGTATITDGDGDSATDSETIDLGGNIRFADDGPTASSVTDPDILDDEGLTAGISGGLGDAPGALTSTGGNLGYNAGADGLASISLSGPTTLGSESVASVWDAGTNTMTISSVRGTLMTIIVTTSTGDYTVSP